MRNENEEMNNGLRRVAMAVALGVLLVLAGCSSEELGSSEKPAGTEAGGNTIVLGVKEVRSAVTRSQHTGSMDFTQLKSTGFGVYGYQGAYDSSSSTPTLFADNASNTHVTWVSGGTDPTTTLVHPGSWIYTATATDQKEWVTTYKYTFFAYAPYMADASNSGPGITSVKTDVVTGDPTIGYTVATNPAQSVDLLWGVRSDDGTANTSSVNNGKPWLDCTQMETASTVLFTFCHALCAVGFHAQVMADQTNDTDNLGDMSRLGTIGSADGCKVTLRSITLTPVTTSFTKSAVLNLNNDKKFKPNWSGYSGTIASLTLDNGEIDTKLLDPVANLGTDDYYSSGTTLNVNGSQTGVMTDLSVPGITETANTQPVIANDDLFMLIPQDKQDYTVRIQYYMTYKTGEDTYHRQSFEGTATLRNIELVAGVKYYFNLVFGLTTFKVSVDAVDWNESTSSVTIATETGTSASNSLAREMRSED